MARKVPYRFTFARNATTRDRTVGEVAVPETATPREIEQLILEQIDGDCFELRWERVSDYRM